ncbi:MAG: sterol desaturase/sphingolipid hydroxylase (fatty acid hydroxylase superfamily) [Candidatus Azotimanducaceae bacterium]|jgi:sterol desaturase/sphingolipid hydroxylase (fatty acid hydroxylase superfamily)
MDDILAQLAEDKLSAIFLPIFVIAILLESVYSYQQKSTLYRAKDTFASLSMLVLSAIVEFFPKILAFYIFFQLHELSPLRDIIQRQWWAWLILFFLDDFLYYCFHRANHEVRLFWAGHVPHHSSEYLNFGTALRQGVGERVHKFIFWLPLPLLGFDPLMIFIMISISLSYQFFVHTELLRKLPQVVELIFNTPSHHRVHHASNIRYLDCNHGGVLIIWDRLFGTFSEELTSEPAVYGLTTNINSFNPMKIALGEYASLARDLAEASTLKDRLKYLFLAPGWHHEGPDKRAKVQREALNTKR